MEPGTGIPVIGLGIIAKEAQTVGLCDQRQAVLEKEAAKMLEMNPRSVGGEKDRAQEFAGRIIDGQQQGLFFSGGPPLVDGGIVLPEFIDAGAFPGWQALGRGSGWQMKSGKWALAKAVTDSRWRLNPKRVGLPTGEGGLGEIKAVWRPVIIQGNYPMGEIRRNYSSHGHEKHRAVAR